jgi:hypothetical protein
MTIPFFVLDANTEPAFSIRSLPAKNAQITNLLSIRDVLGSYLELLDRVLFVASSLKTKIERQHSVVRNALQPVSMLFEDILGNIFEITAGPYLNDVHCVHLIETRRCTGYLSSTYRKLPQVVASHVNTFWRNTALNRRRLWGHLHVRIKDMEKPAMLTFAQIWAARSPWSRFHLHLDLEGKSPISQLSVIPMLHDYIFAISFDDQSTPYPILPESVGIDEVGYCLIVCLTSVKYSSQYTTTERPPRFCKRSSPASFLG